MNTDYKKIEQEKSPEKMDYVEMTNGLNLLTMDSYIPAIRELNLTPGSRGLDLGCGAGNHTLHLAEQVAPDGHVTALDISKAHLDFAGSMIQSSPYGDMVDFVRGDYNNLPFKDNTFDWLWSADVVHPVPDNHQGPGCKDPVSVVREMARVVKPGGKLALALWLHQMVLPGYMALETRLNAASIPFNHHFNVDRPEKARVMAGMWLREAGLKNIKVKAFSSAITGPFDEKAGKIMALAFQMFFGKAEHAASKEDWEEYLRLCSPESDDFILNNPDYVGIQVAGLFYGEK